MLDLVIKNALIYDGTGGEPFKGDVGIRGNKIHAIGRLTEEAQKTIDAEGLVLSPGFVDIHSHSDYFLLINPGADSKITQGVTTEIGGNCGYAAAPVWGEAKKKREAEYSKHYKLKLGWKSLAEYFRRLEDQGMGINYGQLIGHNTLRYSELGGTKRTPMKKELSHMVQGVHTGMREGAFGVSTGLIYPPACFSKRSEIVELAKACGECSGIFTFHMRSESDRLVEAVEEALDIGKKAALPIQISHIKTSGQRNWGKIDEVLKRIEASQKEGVDVAADRYPYVASQTGLMQVLPEWTFEGGIKGLVKRLRSKKMRSRIQKEVLKIHPPQEDYLNKVLIMEVMSKKNKKFEGLTVQKAAEKAKKDLFEFLFDLLVEEEAAISAIYFTMSEDNLKKFLSKEYIFVASDSGCRSIKGPLAKGRPHPRIFGTFPRVIRKYVREEKLLDLGKAIYKMTWQPAERFRIAKRGKIAEGFFADLILFDFDKISDRSDFLNPFHYAEGIEGVWVNGILAVEKGRLTGARGGHVLRKIS